MEILPDFITSMNKEELRFFKIFAHRQASNGERKDLALLDWLRKNQKAKSEIDFIEKHYSMDNRNAYYRLKNRLLEDLGQSLFLQHQQDDLLQLFSICGLVKIFMGKQNYQLALHYLKKAEKKAITLEQYEMLDFIYGDYIKLSHELIEINPSDILIKRKQNSLMLNQIRAMDDLLALVSYQLKISQNFNMATDELLQAIEKTIKAQSDSDEFRKSPKFRTKIYGLISQLFLQRHDYKSLEAYSEQTFYEFIQSKFFHKQNHDLKLQMLTYIVNSAFKNQNTAKSLEYAEKLNLAIEEFDGMLKSKYEVFYFNALVNNYTLSDSRKAIALLENLLKEKKFAHLPFYDLFLRINLATSYFDNKEFHKASRLLAQTMLSESFKQADIQVQYKVNVADLIIRCELKDYDFLKHRIEQVKKDFRSIFNEHAKDKSLIELLAWCARHAKGPEDEKLRDRLIEFLNQYQGSDEENELIRYVTWLNGKKT